MALKKPVNGAWEDVPSVNKPVDGAWESCAAVCKPVDGAWEKVWTNKAEPLYLIKDSIPNTDYVDSDAYGVWWYSNTSGNESQGEVQQPVVGRHAYYMWTALDEWEEYYFSSHMALEDLTHDSLFKLYMIDKGYTTFTMEYSLYAIDAGSAEELPNITQDYFDIFATLDMAIAAYEGGTYEQYTVGQQNLYVGHNNTMTFDISNYNMFIELDINIDFGPYDMYFEIHNVYFS